MIATPDESPETEPRLSRGIRVAVGVAIGFVALIGFYFVCPFFWAFVVDPMEAAGLGAVFDRLVAPIEWLAERSPAYERFAGGQVDFVMELLN